MEDKKTTKENISQKSTGSSKSEVLEGAEELIAEWGYALDEMSFKSNEGLNNFREIETDAANHWIQKVAGKLPKTKTAYEAAMKFRDLADERKVILKENFKLEEKEETVLGTFLSHDCPYKNCCILRKKERKPYICFRAAPFIIAMKLMTDKEYKSEILYEQTNPGKICIVKGMPTQRAFKVGLSYKLSKGTVKINDIDLAKIGIGLIDNVTITPSRKEIGGKKLTAMSYSQTKYPAGMILMNMQDAKSLGLEEKDTVYVTKAGAGEESKLVDTETYKSETGEYEMDGMEELPDIEDIEGIKKEGGKEIKESREGVEEGKEEGVEKPEEGTEEKSAEEKPVKKSEKIPEQKPIKPKKKELTPEPIKQKQKSENKNKQKKDFESQIEALRNA